MKVLVTGGAGFIGSNLVDTLIVEGHKVSILDNLSSGKSIYINPKAKFILMDILDEKITEVIAKETPDVIFHLASQVSVSNSILKPVFDVRNNVEGSINIIEAAAKCGVTKIIYSSSAAVYGIPCTLPIDENHPIKPISPYGVSKHTTEHYLELYHRLYGINYTILRYANVYGPRQDVLGEAGVVAIFSDRIRNKNPLVVYGDGEQTRDFVYVEDVVKANLLAIKQADNQIINISTNKVSTLNRLIKVLQEVSGIQPDVVYQASKPGDIRSSVLANELAYKVLSWVPEYSLEDGLLKMFEVI